ncbi:MAG: SGNH/GDSL hydrolase family protein [Chloroflexi bacterium]|nr:SGNH/GDSL hydrolase family protein [Chloroflexota bacterium]
MKLRFPRRKLVWMLLWVVLPLLLVDLGLRVWFSCCGDERQRIMYVYSPEQIRAARWKIMGLPYLNYGLNPAYPTHNSLGYRGREVQQPKPAGTFRIVALGGSTTYGFGLPRWEDAYPAQLETILREQYGYEQVEVINAGVEWYTSWEMLANFAFRVLDLDPDLIILYEATNDVSFRLVDPQYYTGLNPSRGIWRTDYSYLGPSVLYRVLALNLAWIPNPASIENQIAPLTPIPACGLIFEADRPLCSNLALTPQAVLAANPPIYTERNYRNIIAMAHSNEVAVLLSTWAYFPDPISGLPYENYLAYPFWQDAIAEQNAVVVRLARELNVPYIDLAATMPYNAAFWIDGSHMTALGTQEQASQYAQFLTERGLLP